MHTPAFSCSEASREDLIHLHSPLSSVQLRLQPLQAGLGGLGLLEVVAHHLQLRLFLLDHGGGVLKGRAPLVLQKVQSFAAASVREPGEP